MSESPAVLYARSLSLPLPEPPEQARSLRVLSVHDRALNLVADDGGIVAIVTPDVGDGPFHIVLRQAAPFDFAWPGMTGEWRGKSLVLGNQRVDCSFARRWHPALSPANLPESVLSILAACVDRTGAFQNRWESMDRAAIVRMQRGAALMVAGALRGDEQAAFQGVSLLAGLGPGLTPAGDDYLLGMLARLHMDSSLHGAQRLGRFVAAASLKTTRLSRAWLQHAVRGQFDARWHALRSALLAGEQRAICRAAAGILNVGASSGPQAMAGFLIT